MIGTTNDHATNVNGPEYDLVVVTRAVQCAAPRCASQAGPSARDPVRRLCMMAGDVDAIEDVVS